MKELKFEQNVNDESIIDVIYKDVHIAYIYYERNNFFISFMGEYYVLESIERFFMFGFDTIEKIKTLLTETIEKITKMFN